MYVIHGTFYIVCMFKIKIIVKEKLSMQLKILSSILLILVFLINPIPANAQSVNNVEQDIKKEIDSKIMEIDKLLASNSKSVKLGSQSNNEQRKFADKVNNIHIDIENYLQTINSEKFYNYKQFEELIQKLDKLDLEANKTMTQAAVKKKIWRYGDILFYGIGNKNASREKSFTGHTAVLSTTPLFVIEASKTRRNGAKVHHWNRTNLWSGATGIKQYKVTSIFGKDASVKERKKAVNYGLAQKGEPYKLKTTIFSSNSWYCSKLTMRQWLSVGYDLRGARGLTMSGILLVIPNDIQIDANTRLYKNWGDKTPGLI